MAVPSVITELSTTAASNPPAGSETPNDGDNHLRAAYAFIAQNYANKANLASPTFTGTVTAAALTTTGNTILGDASTDTLNVGNGGLVKDASGNVGVGITPPAWSGVTALDVGVTAALNSDSATARLMHNVYYNGSAYKAKTTSGSSLVSFNNGATYFYAAASVSAGATVTFVEQMQLTSEGYLRMNGASEGGMISVIGSGHGAFIGTSAADNTFSGIRLRRSGGTYTGSVAEFEQNTTTVGSISISSNATTYATSSDYRLKNISGDLQGSGAFIDALKPRVGTWKADGKPFVGFVAHELQEVSPSSVTGEKDGTQMQAVGYGSAELIANMVAELKSLRARVAVLEG